MTTPFGAEFDREMAHASDTEPSGGQFCLVRSSSIIDDTSSSEDKEDQPQQVDAITYDSLGC